MSLCVVHTGLISVQSIFLHPTGVFQVKMDLPVAPGMVAPLDGTPDDQGANATPEGGKKTKVKVLGAELAGGVKKKPTP